MSENRGNGADASVISLADRLYPGGPIEGGPSDERVKALINEGVAKPANSLFRDEPTRPSPAGQERGPSFDVARLPTGFDGDPQTLQSFGAAAREIGLDQQQGDGLVRWYQENEKDYARRLADGAEQLSRELDPEHLATAKALIADPQITPPALRPWIETWGSHPLLAQWIVNLAGMIRNGGRY